MYMQFNEFLTNKVFFQFYYLYNSFCDNFESCKMYKIGIKYEIQLPICSWNIKRFWYLVDII